MAKEAVRRIDGLSTSRKDAERWEEKYRQALERKAAGLEPPGPADTPRFAHWASVHYDHAATRVTRAERVDDLLRVVLRFWGACPSGRDPKNLPKAGEPYHDLRLGDAIADPEWIAKFEDWMDARDRRSDEKPVPLRRAQMYQLALQPRWRTKTGIQTNPMDGIYRDRPGERKVTITPDEMRPLLEHASYHVRLAIAIGALAPKLRLANILALQWRAHLDADLRFITVHQHKTAAKTRRPLVVPISEQLREILRDARRRTPGSYVITYRGKPLTTIRGGIAGAAKAAGLPYGRKLENGLTFQTLRHTAATILTELDVSEGKRKSVMGHRHLATTQKYTHLRRMHEVAPVEQLSATLPIRDVVTRPGRRALRARKPVQASPETAGIPQGKSASAGTRRAAHRDGELVGVQGDRT